MRLKTLKELVDEFGFENITFERNDSLFIRGESQNCGLYVYPYSLGKKIGADQKYPDWAIKGPEKKKLYAYELSGQGSCPMIIFTERDNDSFEEEFTTKRKPEYDLNYKED